MFIHVVKRWGYTITLICITGIFVSLQVFLAINENQSIDEGVHISAGLSYLITGDFRMNPEHPPLAKEIAAFPLLFMNVHIPTEHQSWIEGNQWEFARQFLYHSGNDADTILLMTRIPMIMFSLFLGVVIVRWSYELFGKTSSIVSALLYSTSPLFLTHGHFVTTDIPLALGVMLSAYCFYKMVLFPQLKWVVFVSMAIAFSVTVKFSGLVLFLFIPLLYVIIRMSSHRINHLTWRHLLLFIFFSIVFSLMTIFVTTGGTSGSFASDPYSGQYQINQLDERFADGSLPEGLYSTYRSIITSTTFPAYPYVVGFSEFVRHLQIGHDSYFKGQISSQGFPLYFPIAFIIKMRLGELVLLSLFLTLFVKSAVDRIFRKKNLFYNVHTHVKVSCIILVILPILFMLISLPSKVNIGVRHILHVIPFIYVLIGILFSIKFKFQKTIRMALIGITFATIVSGFVVFPFTMTYFSEIIGGASKGHQYLLDSNLDWGQNLKYLKRYMDSKEISSVCIAYFGQGNFSYEGIDARWLPDNTDIRVTQKPDCIAVASAQVLFTDQNPSWSWLKNEKLMDIIGNSLYVFDIRSNLIEKSLDL